MMVKKIKLHPCHECSGEAKFMIREATGIVMSFVYVQCTKCGMCTKTFSGLGKPDEFKQQAAEAWNAWQNITGTRPYEIIKSQSIQNRR